MMNKHRSSMKHCLRRSTTPFALLAALLGSGLAVAAAPAAYASSEVAVADHAQSPGLRGFLPLAEVGKPYAGEVSMHYPRGHIVSVTVEEAKLPPGITARVNPDDTIRVWGTTTQVGQFALAVSMVGLTHDGQIENGSSSREVIVSGPLKIGTPPAVAQGIPVSAQLPISYLTGKVTEVSATGLPSGLSISPTGLITGTTYDSGTFPVAFTAKGSPSGIPPYVEPISTTLQHDMVIAPWTLELPASSPPWGEIGRYYLWQLPIQHPQGETVSVTATGLPAGLTVSPTGVVSGYPNGGDYRPTFTVTARPHGAPWVVEKSVTVPLNISWH